MYLLIAIAIIPGYTISLMFAWFLSNFGFNELICFIIAILLGVAILSLPLLLNNYKVSKEINIKRGKKINLVFLILINHMSSYFLSCTLYVILLYLNN